MRYYFLTLLVALRRVFSNFHFITFKSCLSMVDEGSGLNTLKFDPHFLYQAITEIGWRVCPEGCFFDKRQQIRGYLSLYAAPPNHSQRENWAHLLQAHQGYLAEEVHNVNIIKTRIVNVLILLWVHQVHLLWTDLHQGLLVIG